MAADENSARDIDNALRSWRQGDFVLMDGEFFHLADLKQPITSASSEAATLLAEDGQELGLESVFSKVVGFAVVSQTCDIVRSANKRPFAEVSPLVAVDANTLSEVRKRRRPAMAPIPSLLSKQIVVDLDRTMTIEKAILAGWDRREGCRTDDERRAFAAALSRKRSRYPFPDAFNPSTMAFRTHIANALKEGGEEGAHVEALSEVRVLAEPSWDDIHPKLTYYFISEERPNGHAANWATWIEGWAKVLTPQGYALADFLACTLEDLTARDYLDSVELDLEAVSPPGDRVG